MTARTHLDRSRNERRVRMKKRRRLILLLAAVILLVVSLVKLAAAPETAIAQRHAKQPADPTTSSESKPQGEEMVKPRGEDARPQGKIVYLTFDDGPSQWTGKFLDVLQEQGVKATFFMQGSNLKRKSLQSDVKRAVREGHYVGGHSMTHQYKKLYEQGEFVSEMQETLSLIHDITGENPHLVRPPYGSAPGLNDEPIRDRIADAGIKIWDWTIDSNDWNLKDHPEQIIENVKKATKVDLEVVLMHEKPQTLQVLPDIIAFYREAGYEFGVYDDAEHFHLNFQKDHRL
ncbi:polysaccharide deacetylase family protein [Paenibacillus sp. CECT 9249]|uniref:polysaccharide deacetylase family protein n=1 Tax=Paenibacillus sp. CECT 9249 TaxID=2845385 RepID=UPI001E370850|nr:polysaccharide deacetylase family protein [Paenibacillus sp. CECT 9249]